MLFRSVEKRIIEDVENVFYPTKPVVPFLDIVHDRAVLELFRGCTRGCRFCQAGIDVYKRQAYFNVPVNKKSNDTNSKSNKETATGTSINKGQKPQNAVTSGQPRKDYYGRDNRRCIR